MSVFYPSRQGLWYDNDFINQVNNLFKQVPDSIESKLKIPSAIITPHAGLNYSGLVSAYSYYTINSQFSLIVILSTYHQYKKGLILPNFSEVIYKGIGTLKIETTLRNNILNNGLFILDDTSNTEFTKEHSWELQLPFLMVKSKDSYILPILIGDISDSDLKDASSFLISTIDSLYDLNNVLFVITSDFTHYGPNYNYTVKTNDVSSFLNEKDLLDRNYLLSRSLSDFKKNEKKVCGKQALLFWLYSIPYIEELIGPISEKFLYYSRYNNNNNYVSYNSIVYYNDMSFLSSIPRLTVNILKIIFENDLNLISKLINDSNAVDSLFNNILVTYNNKIPSFPRYDNNNNILCRGIFVTEEYGGHGLPTNSEFFQGDIGLFYDYVLSILNNNPKYTMVHIVIYDTLKTIFLDDRFDHNPLRYNHNYKHLDKCYFSINLLNKQFKIDISNFWSEYKPCRMGIILKYGDNQATFLPSVITNWLKNCKITKEEEEDFAYNLFSSLFSKMGLVNIDWKQWQNKKLSKIYLYRGFEFNEIYH